MRIQFPEGVNMYMDATGKKWVADANGGIDVTSDMVHNFGIAFMAQATIVPAAPVKLEKVNAPAVMSAPVEMIVHVPVAEPEPMHKVLEDEGTAEHSAEATAASS